MDKNNIQKFLVELTGNASLETVDAGDWVMTNCPLAPWKHEQGTDSKPSFGIHVSDSASVFHCFTCKSKGTLPQLVRQYEKYTGESYTGLLEGLSMGEMLGPQLPEWETRLASSNVVKLGTPLDEMLLDAYEPAAGHPYLRRRGISDTTALKLGLVVDPDNYGVERILFPVRSVDGGLYGFTGRATTRVEPRVRDYFGLPKKLLLLGAEHIEEDSYKSIVVVEGLFDFARVFQCGYRVVAVMFSGMTEAQARILKTFGSPVISFLDNDKAGDRGHREIVKKLGNVVPVLKAVYPTRKAKDPGDLSCVQIADAISRAELC